MLQDLRFGVRMLLKRPGFTALAALTLALGIGATAAVFSLVEGVLLTPPPYRDPDRLVLVPSVHVDSQQVERIERDPGDPVDGLAETGRRRSTAIAAYSWTFNFVVDDGGSESFEGMVVTPDYFRVVGVQPMLGRAFVASDTAPPAAVDHSRLRLLAAPLQRRSRDRRQDDSHEPARHAADRRRRHAAAACASCRRPARRRSRTTTSTRRSISGCPARRIRSG